MSLETPPYRLGPSQTEGRPFLSQAAHTVGQMVCLSCRRLTPSALCPTCAGDLRSGPDRLIGNNLRVRTAFAHAGAARDLVHNFKYRGIEPAGVMLAQAMAPLVPEGVALVPLPRVDWRLIRYGLAPASFLARHLSALTGQPTVEVLATAPFSRDQARRSRNQRIPPMFSLRRPPSGPLALIDDVVTTGGTLQSAHRALGPAVTIAVTATGSHR